EPEIFHKPAETVKTRENRIFPTERAAAKRELKNRLRMLDPGLLVGIDHGEFVEIRKERRAFVGRCHSRTTIRKPSVFESRLAAAGIRVRGWAMQEKRNPRTALLVIDQQLDFQPGGALPVSGGDQIVEPLIQQMDAFDVIVMTQDSHPAGHIS